MTFTKEEHQAILNCVLFSTCTDSCWDNAHDPKTIETHKNILQKFADAGQAVQKNLYIFDTPYHEEPELVKFVTERKLAVQRESKDD